jgi:hypothetical protein
MLLKEFAAANRLKTKNTGAEDILAGTSVAFNLPSGTNSAVQ